MHKPDYGLFFKGCRFSGLIVGVLLLSGTFLYAAAPETGKVLTLEEALKITAELSLQAESAKLNNASARDKTEQAKSLYYPSVALKGGHVNLDNGPAFKFGSNVFPAGEQVYWKHSISAREILWDGGRRAAAVKAGKKGEKAVALQGEEALKRAQAEIVALYVGAMTAKEEQKVVAMRRVALEDHLKIVRDLFKEGVVARNDLLRTEVALRFVEDQARVLDNAYATAIERLNRAMGRVPSTPVVLPASLSPPPPVPWDEAQCGRVSIENNDGVMALKARAEALKETLSLKKKAYFPSVIVEAGHSYEQNRYMEYPNVNSIFLGFSWNIFDGGYRASMVRQAHSKLDLALRELTEAGRAVEVAAESALRDYKEARRETETARLNVSAAEENYRIVENQYKAGLLKTTDVLDAESVLAESRFKEADTYYQAYAKEALLLASMGKNLTTFYAQVGGPVAQKEK